MAKPNYQYEKRQRDLAKKNKQEEKRRQKLADKAGGDASNEATPADTDAVPPASTDGDTPSEG